MTCQQLGGACDLAFQAETFDEIAQMSKDHGMKMFQKGDQAHLKSMKQMTQLMQTPKEMQKWFDARRTEFNALPST